MQALHGPGHDLDGVTDVARTSTSDPCSSNAGPRITAQRRNKRGASDGEIGGLTERKQPFHVDHGQARVPRSSGQESLVNSGATRRGVECHMNRRRFHAALAPKADDHGEA